MPTPHGDIAVSVNTKQIKVSTVGGKGVLRFNSSKKPSSKNGLITKTGVNSYEVQLEGSREYIVNYAAN